MTFLQGDYAKRHIPFKPDGSGAAYGPSDFTIGAQIPVSGRMFTIVDADESTRRLMQTRFGINLGAPLPIPSSFKPHVGGIVGHTPHLNKVVCDMGSEEDPVNGFYKRMGDTKGKFMDFGSATLRFEAEWRETSEPFGDRRRFAVQYYLADDTIEVLDKSSPHSQGGQFSKFVKRQRLARLPVEAGMDKVVSKYGERETSAASPEEIINMSNIARGKYKFTEGPNVWAKAISPITGLPIYRPTTSKTASAPRTCGGFPVLSSLASTPDFITAADLICGGVISIYGRPLLIKTCDPFTVAFGIQKLGIDQRRGFITDPASVASERAATFPNLVPKGSIPLPPHTGTLAVGSEEETRVNAYKMVPTYRSERDADKLYQLQGKCLRFESRMDPRFCDPDDSKREFVVSFFLEDDTMSIVEIIRDRKGASATRWLSRGAHRNFRASPDPKAVAAVLGNKPGTVLDPEVQAAYDRVAGLPGDRFGYGEGSGYSGGVYGKADRVGPGGTGVASVGDMGIRDPTTHGYSPPPGLFTANDFYTGAEIQLAHAPSQVFVLGRGDGFTEAYMAAREAQRAGDARDVFVADNTNPVPSLPLEGAGLGPEIDALISTDVQQSALVIAKVLSGVIVSAQNVVRQSDRNDRGIAPKAVMKSVLARYGCKPPTCSEAVVDTVLDAFVVGTGAECLARERAIENARSTKHPQYRPSTPAAAPRHNPVPAGSPSSTRAPNLNEENPLRGPELIDFLSARFSDEPMIDYAKLFTSIKAVAERQQVLQPRLDKLISQLRTALLSSRTHLRRVFRDLDVSGTGVITFAEMRNLLLRHHLDIGLNDAQIRSLMARFPPADSGAVDKHGQPSISWRGFLETILDAKTLAPGEMDGLVDFVRGVHDNEAANGVGGTRVWPEVYPHVNQVSSWTAGDMNLARFGVTENAAPPRQNAASAPPAHSSVVNAQRPATMQSAVQNAPVIPIFGAPEVPGSRPRTAPAGTSDPRPAPEKAVLDVIEALSSSAKGAEVLKRMRGTFGTRRLELYKALALFDTARRNVLTSGAFVEAIISAGLKLTTVQKAELIKEICRLAAGNNGLLPPPHDVYIDYGAFIESLYSDL